MQVIPIYNAYGFNLENKVYSNYTGGLVYQFDPVFNFDPFIPFVNLSLPTTTVAVHKTKDVYFSYFLKDQNGYDLSYTNEIADNHYVNSIDIDILNSNTNIFRKNYITGSFQDNFTITNVDNINLFNQYNKDFGVRINISGRDAKTHINNIYVLGNVLELNKVNVSDGIGSWSNLDPIGYQKVSSTIQSGVSGYLTSVRNSALYLDNWTLETIDYNTTLTSQIDFARLTGESIIIDWGDNTQDLIFKQTGVSSYSGSGVTRSLTSITDSLLTGLIYPTGINGYSYSFSKLHSYANTGEINEKNINIYYSGSGSTSLELISNFKQTIPYSLNDKGFNIGGLGSTGSIDFDIEFFNDSKYTKYDRIEVYASESPEFAKSTDTLIKTIPLQQDIKNISFKIEDDPIIDYDKNYWFRLCPFSDLGAGYEWDVGPYILSKYFSPVPIFTSIITGTITGFNNGSDPQIIDSIAKSDIYYTYDYTTQFNDKYNHFCSSKLLIVDNSFGQDPNRTGVSFAESNVSDDGFIHYDVDDDVDNIYLTAHIDYSQFDRDVADGDYATYRIYKISV